MHRKTLQIHVAGKWKYVFCYSHYNKIITTPYRKKALSAGDLDYFENRFSANQFRTS